MKRIDIGAALVLFLVLFLASYALAQSGPRYPVFYLKDVLTLEDRGLTRELKGGREVVIFKGECYVVKRWSAGDESRVPYGTMIKTRRLLDSIPPTDAQWVKCFGNNFVQWAVASYWRGDMRPMYEWSGGERGKRIGYVKVGTKCERKRLQDSSRGRQYRMTSNGDLRGAALCERQ